jgi:IS1 family transposase
VALSAAQGEQGLDLEGLRPGGWLTGKCGDRDERTFRRLFDRFARWKVRLFCSDSYSDSYVVYPLVLAVGRHYQGKGETAALERNNAQQRHWTVVLRRRSIVVSKSLAMIERRVRSVRPFPCQQGCRSRNVQAADPSWRDLRTCLKCSISP